MSETETGGKWTPGPWKLDGIKSPCILKDDGFGFLKMCSPWREDAWEDDPEALANMHLMAASPAMAEALEECLVSMELAGIPDDAPSVAAARAALKLAKGE